MAVAWNGTLCLLVVGLAIITFGGKFGWLKEASLQQSKRADTALEEDHAQPEDGRIEIGGVRRPASDLQPQWGDRQPSGTPATYDQIVTVSGFGDGVEVFGLTPAAV